MNLHFKMFKRKVLFNHVLMAVFFPIIFAIIPSCKNATPQKAPDEVVIVNKPEEVQPKANEQLNKLVSFLEASEGKLNDSTQIANYHLLSRLYETGDFQPLWSNAAQWLPAGDTLFTLISKSKEYGLFPSDYHFPAILSARNKIVIDTINRKNIALWTRTDILMTDAFFQMARHLKFGHLERDSTTLRPDSVFRDEELVRLLKEALVTNQIRQSLEALEPTLAGYKAIRQALPAFLDSVKFKEYTYIIYPNKDSLEVISQVAKRLQEAGILDKNWDSADTLKYKLAVRQYQQKNGIRTTGIAAEQTIGSLNNTNWEKFKRIVINLDRYKQLGTQMPETYLWVNLPAYQLSVIDADTLVLQSKIIVGAPKTRTPVLTSEIVNFITYPQWTVPYSIIFKEMLPKIQKSIDYLDKQNLMVVDKNDSVINPASIDWFKLNKEHFPYLLRQRQGDDNSLGLMKFNFRNKYDVYLHDTNARGLFSRSIRSLSHGCVRVQEWEKLSDFLVRNNEIRYPPDTLKAWINRQEKHVITDFLHVPIFIRYFTCEGQDNKIRFYEDIYEDDRLLSQRYFRSKPIN
ncbi:L,D-transpeptidase family protein [Flavihumibacter profundi]|uniref:L,D-transpeptidase family protein n=1 Tax=Flavihumibacter profundi TaxID=2716883 RepID=UPI001CC5AA95|nr:L,D-transpeptidase family protein [Flavihumibacter profundi]MBZ5856731.1 L,D-transpeptidase family protein [Flavihumibacter profundi]